MSKKNSNSDLTLTSRSQKAEDINLLKLNNITTKEYKFYASYTGDYFEGKTNKALPSPKELNLKIGAKVVFTESRKRISKWYNRNRKRVR